LAIIPVNEKALLQTTEGANIHMYGTGVLQKQVVLISDSVGSTWKDSIINDFEESVFAKIPQLSKYKEALYNSGAVYAAMSGSGSTMFGIFKK
jgi:4-diphosphocytidyl-2C-methyl-D-erythritol kinase